MTDQKISAAIPRTKKSFSLRESAHKYLQEKEMPHFATLHSLDPYDSLSYHRAKYSNQKRLSADHIVDYVLQALEKIYESDSIGVKTRTIEFLKSKLPQMKFKIQQRLSLLKYLEQSLKYKLLSEIDVEIQKEWRKNVLLHSLTTIWARSMLLHQFSGKKDFIEEYEKQRNFVANVTNYYFRTVLQIQQKKGSTFDFIYQDSSHHIINSLKDWRQIYDQKFIPLLTPKKGNEYEIPNLDYDLNTLEINKQYIDVDDKTNQLEKTTQKIQAFTEECRIHQRINLLKQIRVTFLSEIEANQQRIAQNRTFKSVKTLEKDDIIGCMIYCIIKAQIHSLEISLKALALLLGKKSQLLNKKGADCCRADLESAIQHLEEEQLNSPLITLPKELMLTGL